LKTIQFKLKIISHDLIYGTNNTVKIIQQTLMQFLHTGTPFCLSTGSESPTITLNYLQ